MAGLYINLLGLRVFLSSIGLVGNVCLILSILHEKASHLKPFELFLLGLAATNLEEIVTINVYDMVVLLTPGAVTGWLCGWLKFLTTFGEIASIFFTVIISVFRYEKLRDIKKRVLCSSVRAAWLTSGSCLVSSLLFSIPIVAINAKTFMMNSTGCPVDSFQCGENYHPKPNCAYKYLFVLVCNLLPLLIVAVTSCLLIAALLSRRKSITPELSTGQSNQICRTGRDLRLHRSTVAVVAAMGLFLVNWTVFLIFQWTFITFDLPFWSEIEFLFSTSYTSFCPYVYGMGHNLFSLKNFQKV